MAQTSMRLAKKGKARLRRDLGIILPHYSKIYGKRVENKIPIG
jgi:hypothetical protein